MRVFLAVEFSEDIKESLVQIQQAVRRESLKGNFTLKENLHLTIQFIGEIDGEQLEPLKNAVKEVAQIQQSFELSIKGLGQFPRGNNKIIWVGLDDSEPMQKMYLASKKALEKQGYVLDQKGFTPHITIGRQVVLAKEWSQLEKQIYIEKIKIPVEKITLMESTRVKGQLQYNPIYSQDLASI